MRPVPKALAQKWKKRLKKSGFVDLEVGENSDNSLLSKKFASRLCFGLDTSREIDQEEIGGDDTLANAEYYERARALVPHVYPMYRTIWRLHAEGHGYVTISEATGQTVRRVGQVIRSYQASMGVRESEAKYQVSLRRRIRLAVHVLELPKVLALAAVMLGWSGPQIADYDLQGFGLAR